MRELIHCEKDNQINKRKSEEDRREKYTTKNFHRKKKKNQKTNKRNKHRERDTHSNTRETAQ